MTIGYLVVEKEYDYNDEYYYCHSDGGNPVKVFKNPADAEAEARKRSRQKMRDVELAAYVMDGEWDMLFDDPDAAAKKYGINYDDCYIATPADPQLAEQMFDEVKLEFYTVIPVEIE